MSEQEKKRQKISDFFNAKIQPKKVFEIRGVSLWPPSSLDFKPLDYAICGVFENKTNATFHPNINSLKTAMEEKWYKMSKEFILKAWKSFRRCVDTIIEKKMTVILTKFNILYLSFYFVVYFSKLELILFYNLSRLLSY